MARAGEPLDSYQSAARRCSVAMIAGFGAAKLPEQELPEQRVVAIPLPLAIERARNRLCASMPRK